MIITCNECNSSFSVTDGLIKETGSKVKCSKCDSVFMAYPAPPEVDSTIEADDRHPISTEGLGMEDLDSSLDDFLEEDDSLETEISSEADSDDLDVDFGLDQEDVSGPDTVGQEMLGDELPDLGDFEDLAELHGESLTADETENGLDNLEFDLETETNSGAEKAEADFELDSSEDLDLGNLELEEEDSPALQVQSDGDSEDLDLDLAAEAQTDDEMADTGLEVEETDELDLSDLELDIKDEPVLELASVAGSDNIPLDPDLDQEAEGEESGADELDLSDLEEIIDRDETSVAESLASEGLDDLDFELDLTDEAQPVAEMPEAADTAAATDELDLSDLEDIMGSQEDGVSQTATEDSVEDIGLELDFQIDDATQAVDAGVEAEDDDELDFSDLEQMLEPDAAPAVGSATDEDNEELDLQFNIEEPPADSVAATATDEVSEGEQEDDLLDIEELLEQGEDTDSQEAAETADEVIGLPSEVDAALGDDSDAAEDDLELDFDLDGEVQEKEALLDKGATADEQLESQLLATDEVDYLNDTGIEEVEFEEDPEQISVATDEFATDEFTDTSDVYGQTDALPIAEDDFSETAVKAKSRSKKPVLVALLLVILGVGIIIIPNSLGIKIPFISDIKIPYLSDLDLKIPYLSDLLNPEEQDVSGNLKMTPLGKTIDFRFINNPKSGQLLVIRGKIKNEYDQPRSFVKVTGKLYEKGNKLVKSATVYCGNVLSDPQLAAMDIEAINKTMHNKFGNKRSNLKIQSGTTVPFMIVFDKVPQNLDEYTVEVAESSI